MATAPIKHVGRLLTTIVTGGVAIVSVNSDAVVAPSNLQAQADPIIAGFDDSDAAQAAFDNIQARASAVDELDTNKGDTLKLLRAVAGIAIDEINALREWIVSFKAAV